MEHPVWHVYDELCTARLNVHYYTKTLAKAKRFNRWGEMVLAASSSTSIAGLWLFESVAGGFIWKGLGTVAALFAIHRAVTRPAEHIRKLESHLTSHAQLELSLEQLRRRIGTERRYTKEMAQELESVLSVKRSMHTDFVDAEIDEDLRHQCFEQVKEELPADRFFVPDQEAKSDDQRSRVNAE